MPQNQTNAKLSFNFLRPELEKRAIHTFQA